MQISAKGRYAVMAMAFLAKREDNVPCSLAEISKAQDLSLPFLEQIFMRLRQDGIVASVRGPGGGYKIDRPLTSITVADIMKAADEDYEMTRCMNSDLGCVNGTTCLAHHLWNGLSRHIQFFLETVTLADIANGTRFDLPDLNFSDTDKQVRL